MKNGQNLCFYDVILSKLGYAYDYLIGRLDFYEKLSKGEATTIVRAGEYYGDNCYREDTEVTIDNSNITDENIRLGISRDILYSAMIGTPELAIFKITQKKLKENNISAYHMPQIKGYDSYINENSIGTSYPFLNSLYQDAKRDVAKRDNLKNANEQEIEHVAILKASDWLIEAMQYNDSSRGKGSPYTASINQAIDWARLGDEKVKAQFRGMRQKIQGVDLHNIGRFIGKCGVNKHEEDRKKLYGQIEFLEKSNDNKAKEEFLARKNYLAIKQQEIWLDKEKSKLIKNKDKAYLSIEKLNLPEEEKNLQIQSIEADYNKGIELAENNYKNEVDRLKSRDIITLINDLKQRQQLIQNRYEKRKNLAQKALDLHWMKHDNNKDNNEINENNNEENNSVGFKIFDWINDAPLGTIKRCHKMMTRGRSDTEITKYAIVEMICGKRGINKDDFNYISSLYNEAITMRKWPDKLYKMVKIGNILNYYKDAVPLEDIAQMAEQNFSFEGMRYALTKYSLDEVKEFINKKIDLHNVTDIKNITEKHQYSLNNNEIIEMSLYNCNGLDEALQIFDLDTAIILLKENVYLPLAIDIKNNAKLFDYELTISQIIAISKNESSNMEDFILALKNLPLKQIMKLTKNKISYDEYLQTKSVLRKNKYNDDFSATLDIAKKLNTNYEYNVFNLAMNIYSLTDVKNILNQNVRLQDIIDISHILKNKNILTNLNETIKFSQATNADQFRTAIDKFGIDQVRELIAKNILLGHAISVYQDIQDHNLICFNDLTTIIAIAKYGTDLKSIKNIKIPEVMIASQREFIRLLRQNKVQNAIKIINNFNLDPAEVLSSCVNFFETNYALNYPELHNLLTLTLKEKDYFAQNFQAIVKLCDLEKIKTANDINKLCLLTQKMGGFLTPTLALKYLNCKTEEAENNLIEQYHNLMNQVLGSEKIANPTDPLTIEAIYLAYRPTGYTETSILDKIKNGNVKDFSHHLDRINFNKSGYNFKLKPLQEEIKGYLDVENLNKLDKVLFDSKVDLYEQIKVINPANNEAQNADKSKDKPEKQMINQTENNEAEDNERKKKKEDEIKSAEFVNQQKLLGYFLNLTNDDRVNNYKNNKNSQDNNWDKTRLQKLKEICSIIPKEEEFKEHIKQILQNDKKLLTIVSDLIERESLQLMNVKMNKAHFSKEERKEFKGEKQAIEHIIKVLNKDLLADINKLFENKEIEELFSKEDIALMKEQDREDLLNDLQDFRVKMFFDADDAFEMCTERLICKLKKIAKEVIQKNIQPELKKFVIEKTETGIPAKAVISKNIGSFFAKAGAELCTKDNTNIWQENRHYHLNIIINKQIIGNVMLYFEPLPGISTNLATVSPATHRFVVRGFNPRVDAMNEYDRGEMARELVHTCEQIGANNGFNEIYYPPQTAWHALSNRDGMAKEVIKIAEKNCKKITSLTNHPPLEIADADFSPKELNSDTKMPLKLLSANFIN